MGAVQMLWNSVVVEAYGREPDKRLLGGIKVENVKTGKIVDLEVRSPLAGGRLDPLLGPHLIRPA